MDHSDPDPLPDQNVLSIVADQAARAADQPLLDSAKAKMLAARAKRVRPHLDDKILASWNGLMLGAIARAYAVLGDKSYRRPRRRIWRFIRQQAVGRTNPKRFITAGAMANGIRFSCSMPMPICWRASSISTKRPLNPAISNSPWIWPNHARQVL